MSRTLTAALYSGIRLAHDQTFATIARKAHALGYELVEFAGWSDSDLGTAGNRGPRWTEAKANGKALSEIQDACEVSTPEGADWPHIIDTVAPAPEYRNYR